MTQMWKDGRTPKVTCSARTISGVPCKRPPIQGSNVCRAHGGAAPQVRAKAQTRILMSADAAAAKLIEMIHSKKVDDRTKLLAVKDLLDRANLGGKQAIEVGIVQPRSFEDFIGDAIVDLDVVESDDSDIVVSPRPDLDVVDADVVEDEPLQNRHDRAAFAEVEREKRRAPVGLVRSPEAEAALGGYRDEAEAQAFADLEKRKRASNANKRREAFMKAIDAGATHDQAHAAGERAVNGEELPPRRRRQFVRGEFAKRPSARD